MDLRFELAQHAVAHLIGKTILGAAAEHQAIDPLARALRARVTLRESRPGVGHTAAGLLLRALETAANAYRRGHASPGQLAEVEKIASELERML